MLLFMSFFCGLIFGLGLTISNMTNPYKVLNFLDLSGHWDPTLLLVMAAAVAVTLIGYRLIARLQKPRFADQFHLPEKTRIEPRLLIGSAIFGIGWGLGGYCPGPGLTALSLLSRDPLYFVIGMVAGSWVFYFLFKNSS